MKEILWEAIARLFAVPAVSSWIIQRAQRTPYFHLEGYMRRWWLFNGYSKDRSLPEQERHRTVRFPRLPSIRVHHILREDLAPHAHDHPWHAARTIILRGWYRESRLERDYSTDVFYEYDRQAGDTASLGFGEYHHVGHVSPGGVWTLFFTWGYGGTWGFLVDDQKVPSDDYERLYGGRPAADPGTTLTSPPHTDGASTP